MKTDLELVQDVKSGLRKSFEELVLRHQRFLMKVVLRMTRDLDAAEDVVQDSFIKAYRRLHLFEGRASFRSWLYQIALNTARNRFRKHSRESPGGDQMEVAVDGRMDQLMMEQDVRSLLLHEVSLLPGRQRQALSLRVFDDLSFKEIAEIMDCPYDTAKANYRHALLKLKKVLGDHVDLKIWQSDVSVALTNSADKTVECDG